MPARRPAVSSGKSAGNALNGPAHHHSGAITGAVRGRRKLVCLKIRRRPRHFGGPGGSQPHFHSLINMCILVVKLMHEIINCYLIIDFRLFCAVVCLRKIFAALSLPLFANRTQCYLTPSAVYATDVIADVLGTMASYRSVEAIAPTHSITACNYNLS